MKKLSRRKQGVTLSFSRPRAVIKQKSNKLNPRALCKFDEIDFVLTVGFLQAYSTRHFGAFEPISRAHDRAHERIGSVNHMRSFKAYDVNLP
ncbi:unnamed protein product [Colias eurytheme]|nr:unnamed protein product [Colias eurytheme]